MYLQRTRIVPTAILVARFPRMNAARTATEWERALSVLRPELARRLVLTAITADAAVVLPPDDPNGTRIAAILQERSPTAANSHSRAPAAGHRWSAKSFEIWKILLEAWLRREAPLPLHEIQRRAGVSYPTVAKLLEHLRASGEIERTSSRSVSLIDLPRRTLSEVAALRHGLRPTHFFYDRIHASPDLAALARRVATKTGRDAGLGGVAGARHYMPSFDLNGLPRVDVTAAEGVDVLRLAKRIDPALGRSRAVPARARTV